MISADQLEIKLEIIGLETSVLMIKPDRLAINIVHVQRATYQFRCVDFIA